MSVDINVAGFLIVAIINIVALIDRRDKNIKRDAIMQEKLKSIDEKLTAMCVSESKVIDMLNNHEKRLIKVEIKLGVEDQT